ncbi:V-type ATP synthase subunit D [Methanopyrus kandleri]|uniref:A-type ATP synthase subunit D n=2 Tax=Methanopyrus kandleri TaxID=2320 RepID=AATD_METKA|nr:V-type ATP synthase subunit D [Methanopyrus kandleri]Q8TUS9.1 RecName: Full=V-type ATP synthase subunit D; AltName: Full=V-ATPase subunit D [Methanopyrus kandleri AV19]AAM02887.1 Archaeal/vacuolar-type H+-ATPase subunit D [Methanopyrus kandleri AV19]HII70882.1 V-type ATP synthase subunit D [Methanopyrus kandleri]
MTQEILEDVNPTRMELLKLQDRIELAKKGHKLLKEKRDALIMEFFEMVKRASEIREQAVKKLMEAYSKLAAAKVTVGEIGVERASMATGEEIKVDVGSRNVMGVVVPIIERVSEDGGSKVVYGFADTSGALDEAMRAFTEAIDAVLELAEIEETLRLMAEEIERTKRRVNALEHIVIPRLENTEKYIEMKLDEQERENFVRLKRVKDLIERKKLKEELERVVEEGAELPSFE